METWEITHIIKNLPDLLGLTVCNAQFLAELRATKLLADVDVQAIKAERNRYNRASLMYDILQTRSNGYNGLIRALIATNQSGAAKILLQIPSNKIENLQITLQGSACQLTQLLSKDEIEAIDTWAYNNLTMNDCLQIHERIQAAGTLELVRDTIPKPHALYVPRLLSRRLGVNRDLFEIACSDVFVFKEIKQSKLRKYVKSYGIASSCKKLLHRNITSRFLLLDCDADWKRICDNVKSPAHLIKFEESTETFMLEATTGGSSVIRPYLQHQHDSSSELVSEDTFLEMICVDKVCGVCICDSPGMGKSLLLANLARKAREKWPDRIIAFIQLQSMVLQQESLDDVALKTLDIISTSPFATRILHELYKRNNLHLELFLDGLDEVQHEHLDSATNFLQRICELMQSATVYVTSRPVVRAQLEKAMGMIAYDIQPFNAETQIDYLTNHWAQAASTADKTKLADYAEYCIQGFHQTVKDNERNIVGVPLMCWLLAEVYAGKAATYADTSRKTPTNLPDHFVSSLYEIYKEFTSRQIGETKCNFACLYEMDISKLRCDKACLIYSFHVWQGLKLLVPKYSLKLGKYVSRFEDLLPCQILAPGILDEGQQNHTYVFGHRTFAEYLVAEYIAKKFLCELDGLQATSHLSSQINYLALNEILVTDKKSRYECRHYKDCYHFLFRENVVAYFLDAMILQNCEQSTIYSVKISPFNKTFINWVEACLHENLLGLLNLLMQTAANYKSEPPTWSSQVYDKLLCFWTSFNKHIANVVHMAVVYCDTDTIDNLLQFFKNVLNHNWMKILPHENSLPEIFEQAMIHGDSDRVRYLVERFPFILNKNVFGFWFSHTYKEWETDEKNDGNEKKAKHGNHIEILDVILTNKRFLLEEGYLGSPFLFHIVKCKDLETIKFLVSREINIFALGLYGDTILHVAAYGGDEDFFREILHILGKKWVTSPANTSLNCSVSNRAPNNVRKPDIFEHLFNWPAKRSLQTPLHCAIHNMKDMKLETLDLLLAGGNERRVEAQRFMCVNVDAVNLFGETALHEALTFQRLELVKHLIARGADWTLKTKNECNVVHICAYRGSEQHLKYFLELGCNVNELDLNGNNALQCALDQRWIESDEWNNFDLSKAKILIDTGVNISNKNWYGKTARELAVLHGWPEEIVKLL